MKGHDADHQRKSRSCRSAEGNFVLVASQTVIRCIEGVVLEVLIDRTVEFISAALGELVEEDAAQTVLRRERVGVDLQLVVSA